MSRTLRSIAAVLSLALVGGVASALGCTSVLGLDDLESGSKSLCETVDRCSSRLDAAACDAHVSRGVETLAKSRQTKWIEELSAKSCVESCNSARRCLDKTPICLSRGSSCAAREECCGFVQGTADCDGRSGRCCSRAGVRCASDVDCCTGSGACEPTTGTCGGVVCAQPGAPCASGFECCSGTCDPVTSKCFAEVCFEDGFECSVDAECCSKTCDPSSHTCVTPSCGVLDAPCVPNDAGTGTCCVGLKCYNASGVEGELGVCSKDLCFPEQYDCSNDAQCCPVDDTEQTGYCHPKYHLCRSRKCFALGEACANDVDCCVGTCFDGACRSCSETVCSSDADCCQHEGGDPVTCTQGKAGVSGFCRTLCTASCDHDVCTTGGPLQDKGCGDLAGCIESVCADDWYCCCTGWDSLCVGAVATKCGTSCGF